MTDKELHTLDKMLTNLEIWSTLNKTFANEMIGICSKMRKLMAERKVEPQRGCDAECNKDCAECARESELWRAEQTEPQERSE